MEDMLIMGVMGAQVILEEEWVLEVHIVVAEVHQMEAK